MQTSLTNRRDDSHHLARIAITGATGHVGRELIQQLVARGHAVRALTRQPERIAPLPLVTAVRADFSDPASLGAALDGVDAVFAMSAQPIFAEPVPSHDLALARACVEARVGRVVKLSALGGGGIDPDSPIVQWVGASERAFTESGLDWTLLRPGRFMSNTLGWAAMIRGDGVVSTPLAQREAASIDPADVAAVAALALTGDGHSARSYELSGPESWSPAEEVAILSRELGRPLRVQALSDDAARAGMLRYGMSAHVVEAILRDADGTHGSEVLRTVEQVTGRPARRFVEWVKAHRAAFA
jgi:uncharacterized protein YbjT (DUF2867 family)